MTAPLCTLGCEDVESLLPLVADGALDVNADPALFEHLARCGDCQESLARHDLITLGLAASRAPLRLAPRARHLRLPWPAALAASALVAVGAWLALDTWRQQQSAASSVDPQAKIFRVTGDNGRPVYVVVQGDQASVVDPSAVDGKAVPAEREPARPVNTRPARPRYFEPAPAPK